MKFDENLSAIHGYLCGDGYVTYSENKAKKRYKIGFRNTDILLIKDFQDKFKKYFNLQPHIYEGRCEISNKNINLFLNKDFSYYSYQWTLPDLSKNNLKVWLKAFFDCEGWVESEKGKNRSIKLECVNLRGIKKINKSLYRIGINSNIKTRLRENKKIYRLNIFGLKNLKLFNKNIGFSSVHKKEKLIEAINSYKTYRWEIPNNKKNLITFTKNKGNFNYNKGQIMFYSIKKNNLLNLKKIFRKYNLNSIISKPLFNGNGSKYYSLSIKIKDFEG